MPDQPMELIASRSPLVVDIIGQVYRDLDILHSHEEVSNTRAHLALNHLHEVVENINSDPNLAPAAEPRRYDLSGVVRSADPSGEAFFIPWGPDVEAGMGFNAWPPTQILTITGRNARYRELGPVEYAAYERDRDRIYGYFIEREWPEYKLYFPGGIHDTSVMTVARYPIVVPQFIEDAYNMQPDPFMLKLPPGYNTLIRCRLAKSLAPSLGRGFPVLLEQMLMDAEENIRNRDFHKTRQVSDFFSVGCDDVGIYGRDDVQDLLDGPPYGDW